MRRLWVWATVLVASGALAVPAAAQNGGGLYEPFPEPAPESQVRAFIGGIPAGGRGLQFKLTDRQLDSGTFVGGRGLRPAGRHAASSRAGVGADADLLQGWPIALIAGLAVAASAFALARRRA
ncbi:MAG TPA: hypothetical protein VGF21_14055 [Thermoleophilaceae bacterium]